MNRICQLIDSIAFIVVLVISLTLNVLTGGSGREFFSKRTYRKAVLDGGVWVWSMQAVDWFFSILPSWSNFRTDTHCKDVYWKDVEQAYALIEESQVIKELQAKERASV